jgi:hypothetical protein
VQVVTLAAQHGRRKSGDAKGTQRRTGKIGEEVWSY